MMRRVALYAGAAALVVAAACQQSESPVPRPVGQQVNKVGDISRDILALARREPDAVSSLSGDLENLGGVAAPPSLISELATDVNGAVAGVLLEDEHVRRLAYHLFVVLTASDLTASQMAELKTDVVAVLRDAGAEASTIDPVAARLDEVWRATAAP